MCVYVYVYVCMCTCECRAPEQQAAAGESPWEHQGAAAQAENALLREGYNQVALQLQASSQAEAMARSVSQ